MLVEQFVNGGQVFEDVEEFPSQLLALHSQVGGLAREVARGFHAAHEVVQFRTTVARGYFDGATILLSIQR